MRKICSVLKLVSMLLSKKKLRELVLMIEVIMMVFLITLVLIPINNALVLANGIERASMKSDMVYCVSAPSNPNSLPIDDLCEKTSTVYGVTPKVFSTEAFSYTTQDQNSGYLILVSNDLFSNIELELKKGRFIDDQNEYIPVVISSHLAQKYDVGDIIYCSLNEEKTVVCSVTGILKKNSTLIDVNKQEGSVLTLDAVGFNMAKYDGDFIIAVSNAQIEISEENVDAAILAFEQGTDIDTVVRTLNDSYKNLYNFHSVESLSENTVANSFAKMEWRMVLLFLFTVVVLFNFVAYIVINTHQKRKVLSVMNICGLSFVKSVIINMLSLMSVVLPALLVGLTCSPYILNNMDIEYYGFNVFLGAAITTILVGVILVAIFTSMWQRKHMDTISIYKKG